MVFYWSDLSEARPIAWVGITVLGWGYLIIITIIIIPITYYKYIHRYVYKYVYKYVDKYVDKHRDGGTYTPTGQQPYSTLFPVAILPLSANPLLLTII